MVEHRSKLSHIVCDDDYLLTHRRHANQPRNDTTSEAYTMYFCRNNEIHIFPQYEIIFYVSVSHKQTFCLLGRPVSYLTSKTLAKCEFANRLFRCLLDADQELSIGASQIPFIILLQIRLSSVWAICEYRCSERIWNTHNIKQTNGLKHTRNSRCAGFSEAYVLRFHRVADRHHTALILKMFFRWKYTTLFI